MTASPTIASRPAGIGRDRSGRRPLSLTKVSLATTALLVAVAVAVFAAAAYSLVGLTNARHRESDVIDAAVAADSHLLDLYLDQETGLRGYLTTGDRSFLQPYLSNSPDIPSAEATLRRLVTSIPDAPPELDQVVATHERWVQSYAQPVIALVDAGHIEVARSVPSVNAGKNLFDTIRQEVVELASTIATAQHAIEQTVGTRRNQLWAVLAVSLAAVLLAAVAAAVVNRRLVTEPLADLGRQVAVVAGGDLEHHVDSNGPSEIRELAEAIEVMRARLAASIDDARRSTEALAQEGPAVTALRQALSPLPTSLAGVDVAGRLQPATGYLAGDWWDVFELPGGRSAVVIGDVSGHGAAAGVYAFQLKHLIALAIRAGLEPGAALAAALQDTESTSDELFATAFVAVVDPARGQVAYANAGHPDGVLLHRGGRSPATVEQRPAAPPAAGQTSVPGAPAAEQAPRPVLTAPANGPPADTTPRPVPVVPLAQTGPLLSSIVAAHWESKIEAVVPGDLLVAVTDGITEARDDAGEEFGATRLVAAVASNADADPAVVADDVLEQVNRFTRRGRADDRTIIVAQVADPARRYPLRTGDREPT